MDGAHGDMEANAGVQLEVTNSWIRVSGNGYRGLEGHTDRRENWGFTEGLDVGSEGHFQW